MDVYAVCHFHRSVSPFLLDLYAVPVGGLHRFLEHDLYPKVFLISLGVVEDRWCTRSVPSLTADEMYNICICMRILVDHVIMALLHAVGFDGDNGPVERGFGPMQMALAQTDFLLHKAAECFSIQWSVDRLGELEYPDYNIHRTMEAFFESRRPPSSFSQIPIADAVPPHFKLLEESEQWMEAEQVVEACLIAVSPMDGSIRVETKRDGKVLCVCKDSVGVVVADMVSAPSPGDSSSDVSKGIHCYSSVREGSVDALCPDDQLRSLKVEEWHPDAISALYVLVQSNHKVMAHTVQAPTTMPRVISMFL
ncbi:hypothetical protein B0H13DRAFT_1895478 [Mycena leptocephala]|nr:hypothetical protein B0H13DRAFT_1895478 [Mycena leptocephala]